MREFSKVVQIKTLLYKVGVKTMLRLCILRYYFFIPRAYICDSLVSNLGFNVTMSKKKHYYNDL